MNRLLPITLVLSLLGCRFDTHGLSAGDLGLADRTRDAAPPSDAILADRPEVGASDRGVDLSRDLPPLPPLVPPTYLASKDGWGTRLPLIPSSENLSGLWLSPSGAAWAVGSQGSILHSTAFGRDWRIVASPTAPAQNVLRAVGGSSPSDVWIVGDGGITLHYDGKMLAAVTPPTTATLYGVFAFSPSDVWIVGDSNTVLHFDGGAWTPVTSNAGASTSLRGVWGVAPGEAWVVGSGGTILRCSGGTCSKQIPVTTYLLNAIWGAAANDLWAVGTSGTLLHYDGAAWTATPSGTLAALEAIHGTSAGEVRAVGASGTVIRLSGGSWRSESIPDTLSTLHAIGASGPGNVLVAGTYGTFRRFDGAGWSKLAARPTSTLTSVWTGAGETWAVGKSGLVLRNGLGGWQVITPPSPTGDLNAVWGASATEIWVAGSLGLVARWSSATKTWTSSSTGTSNTLYGLWGRSPSDLYAAGSFGTILHFDGTSWNAPPSPLGFSGTFYGVHGSASHVFVCGSSSRSASYDGKNWSLTDLQESTNYRSVWAYGAGLAWLVGDGGALAHYNGSAWKVSDGSTNLLGLFGLSSTQLWAVGDGGEILAITPPLTTTAEDSDSTVNLTAIHGTSATDLWAVGASSTILHRDDRLP